MMSPASTFRFLIVVSLALELCAAFVDAVFPGLVPEPLRLAQDAVASPDFRTQDILLIVIGLPIFVVGLVSAIGLYRFRKWAPRLALYVTIAGVAIYPLLDAQVMSAWSMLLTETSGLLWGMVLAMAFLPPLADRFHGLHANNSMQPTVRQRTAAD